MLKLTSEKLKFAVVCLENDQSQIVYIGSPDLHFFKIVSCAREWNWEIILLIMDSLEK